MPSCCQIFNYNDSGFWFCDRTFVRHHDSYYGLNILKIGFNRMKVSIDENHWRKKLLKKVKVDRENGSINDFQMIKSN